MFQCSQYIEIRTKWNKMDDFGLVSIFAVSLPKGTIPPESLAILYEPCGTAPAVSSFVPVTMLAGSLAILPESPQFD